MTGGQEGVEDMGSKLENIEVKQLGRAKKIKSEKDATTIIEGDVEADSDYAFA